MNEDTWVTAKIYLKNFEVQLAKPKLDSEGIESFIPGENSVNMHLIPSVMLGGFRLQVKESDLEIAKDILAVD